MLELPIWRLRIHRLGVLPLRIFFKVHAGEARRACGGDDGHKAHGCVVVLLRIVLCRVLRHAHTCSEKHEAEPLEPGKSLAQHEHGEDGSGENFELIAHEVGGSIEVRQGVVQ